MRAANALLTGIGTIPWQRGFDEWRVNDAPTLVYMAKAAAAGLLALWISMALNLPDPKTAIFSVFIVMQPQSGLVFSKSYYRVLGTAAGVGISLLLMGMFAQDPVWFIAFFALWIGIATAAGYKYRNFQSYGFVLAGYTLCIVALPVIETPLDIFEVATSRFSEVLVGILCATLISDIIFPRRLLDSLITSERERFVNILTTLSDAREVFTPLREANGGVAGFSGGVVGLNAVRINSSFESGANQKERQHYQHLNDQYMNLSTTFHSLKSILTAIHMRGGIEAFTALEALYAPVAAALKTLPATPMTPEDFEGVVQKLLELKNTIREDFVTEYAGVRESMDDAWVDQFASAAYLMIRLLDELHGHCVTYISLLKHRLSGKPSLELSRTVRFSTHTDNLLVGLAALRGSGVLLVTMMFWIWTAWPFATQTITIAVIIGLLLGTLPSPLDGVFNFFKGAVLALMMAALYDFYLIPEYTSDMQTLSILIAPVLAFVGWMTTRPKLGVFAFGFVFIFISQSVLDPSYRVEPTKFLEASLASLIGVLFGGLAYLLVNFWSCSLTQQRVAKVLRRRIVNLCVGPIGVERSALESTGRDLVQQFSTQGRLNVRSSRLVYEWLLSTLEIGRAVLAIRRNQQRLYSHYRHPKIEASLICIKYFFEAPSLVLRETLLHSLSETIRILRSENIPTEKIQMKRMHNLISELALIRTVLQNDLSLPIVTEDSCR